MVFFPSPDAILFGLFGAMVVIAAWVILLGISLGFTLRGALSLRSRAGKTMAAGGLLGIIILLGIAYTATAKPRHRLTADFSTSRAAPEGQWSASGIGAQEFMSVQGRVDAHLMFPGGRVFDEEADHVLIDRIGKKVVRVSIHLPSMTLDEAHAKTDHYLKAWGLEKKDLTNWYADRKAGKAGRFGEETLFYSYQNNQHPSLSLELRGLQDDWTLMLKVNWGEE